MPASHDVKPQHHVPPKEFIAINAWKNADGYWEKHPNKLDYAVFMLDWFRELARRMKLESPITSVNDLIFDSPSLKNNTNCQSSEFDFLIINSPALSGQSSNYDVDEMDLLILDLLNKYTVITTCKRSIPVRCTVDEGLSINDIGKLSQVCKYIIMVSTGSSWLTFNKWNADTIIRRFVILDREKVNLSGNTVHVSRVSDLRLELQKINLL